MTMAINVDAMGHVNVNKNVIGRPISIKYLTPPPFSIHSIINLEVALLLRQPLID